MLKYQWTTHTKMLTIYLIEDCVHVNEQTLLSNFNSKSILIFSSTNKKKSSLNSMLYIPRHIFKIRYKTSFPSGYSMRLRAVWNGMEGECCYFSVFPIQKIDDFWKIEQNHKWKSIFWWDHKRNAGFRWHHRRKILDFRGNLTWRRKTSFITTPILHLLTSSNA